MSPAVLLMLYIHTSHSFNDVNNSCFVISADIDECTSGVNDCHKLASCKNTEGSYSCSCQPPYAGDGKNCTQVVNVIGNQLFNFPLDEKKLEDKG